MAVVDLSRALRQNFGFYAFRPGQREACQAALDGRDVLVVMPTGSGKSLCYQLPALIRDELGEDGHGAFLAWGDPTLYESTLTIVTELAARADVAFDYEVVPGISAVSALAARHRIPLNRVGGAVQVTTGRRLAGGLTADADDIVVMLDPSCTFREVAGEGVDIYWGAYLGTADETLVSGPVTEVADEIERVRASEKERKGWIFDTYLLRRK